MQSLKESFKRGVSWNAVSVFGNTLVQALALLIFGLMDPADFFLVAVLQKLMGQAFVLSEFGLATAIVQAKDLRQVHLNTIFVINLLIGVSLSILFCALSPVAAWYFKSPILVPAMVMTSIIFLILSTGLIHKAKLAREVNFRALTIAEVSGYVAFLVLLTALTYLGKGVWAFVWAKVAQQLVETVTMWIAGRYSPDFRDISFRQTKSMLHFGVNMSGAQLVGFLISNIDMLLVGHFFSKPEGAYYFFAQNIVISPAVRFLKLLTRVGVPILSRMQNNLVRMSNSFSLMNKFLALLAFPAFLGLSAAANEIVYALFSAKWLPSVSYVRILSVSIVIHLFAALTIIVYYALARASVLMRFQLIVLVFRATLLCLVVYYTRSILYVCWAILLDRVIFMLAFEHLAFKLMKSKTGPLWRHIMHPLVASMLMVIVVYAISWLGTFHAPGRAWAAVLLSMEIVAGGAVYIGYIILNDPHIMDEVREIITSRRKGKADFVSPDQSVSGV